MAAAFLDKNKLSRSTDVTTFPDVSLWTVDNIVNCAQLTNLLMVEPRIQKGSPVMPILRRIKHFPRIDTYFFKIHCNIVLPSTPRPS